MLFSNNVVVFGLQTQKTERAGIPLRCKVKGVQHGDALQDADVTVSALFLHRHFMVVSNAIPAYR